MTCPSCEKPMNYLMSILEVELIARNIQPVYTFSSRGPLKHPSSTVQLRSNSENPYYFSHFTRRVYTSSGSLSVELSCPSKRRPLPIMTLSEPFPLTSLDLSLRNAETSRGFTLILMSHDHTDSHQSAEPHHRARSLTTPGHRRCDPLAA